jgi:hypothetical protein
MRIVSTRLCFDAIALCDAALSPHLRGQSWHGERLQDREAIVDDVVWWLMEREVLGLSGPGEWVTVAGQRRAGAFCSRTGAVCTCRCRNDVGGSCQPHISRSRLHKQVFSHPDAGLQTRLAEWSLDCALCFCFKVMHICTGGALFHAFWWVIFSASLQMWGELMRCQLRA